MSKTHRDSHLHTNIIHWPNRDPFYGTNVNRALFQS